MITSLQPIASASTSVAHSALLASAWTAEVALLLFMAAFTSIIVALFCGGGVNFKQQAQLPLDDGKRDTEDHR